MIVKQEQLNPCEVELEIEVDAEKVNIAVDQTYSELSKVTNIPGFRKGKAPRAVLERYLDEERVKDGVSEILMKDAYLEALDESKLKPYAAADVELVKLEIGEPMVFRAKVPLAPEVKLGDYVGLKVQRTPRKVTDEDIDAEIGAMLARTAEYSQVEREARTGDTVLLEIKDNSKEDEQPRRNVVVVGENLPDFDNSLVGMNVSDEKVIEVAYPDDFRAEELAGKTVQIWVRLLEVNEKKLPELTDEWVKGAFSPDGQGDGEPNPDAVDTVAKLKDVIRTAMERAAADVADTEVTNTLVKQIVDSSTVNFPQVMVEEMLNERIEELLEELNKRKVILSDYLKHKQMTFEQMRAGFEEDARKNLTITLALREIIEKEEIKVEEDDVEAAIRSMAEERNVPVETVRAYVDRTDGVQSIRNSILQKKTMDFLVHASNIKNVGK